MKKVVIYDIRALLIGNHTPRLLVDTLAKRIPHDSREQYLGWNCYKADKLFAWNYIGVDTDGILRVGDSVDAFLDCPEDEWPVIEMHVCKKGETL